MPVTEVFLNEFSALIQGWEPLERADDCYLYERNDCDRLVNVMAISRDGLYQVMWSDALFSWSFATRDPRHMEDQDPAVGWEPLAGPVVSPDVNLGSLVSEIEGVLHAEDTRHTYCELRVNNTHLATIRRACGPGWIYTDKHGSKTYYAILRTALDRLETDAEKFGTHFSQCIIYGATLNLSGDDWLEAENTTSLVG